MKRYQVFYRGEFLGTYPLNAEALDFFERLDGYELRKESTPGFFVFGLADVEAIHKHLSETFGEEHPWRNKK